MTQNPTSYRREFRRSRQHLWIGILTLGLGFASGQALGLVAGGVLYALAHLYVPDFGWFRRKIDARRQAEAEAELAGMANERVQQLEAILATLSPARRKQYDALWSVCRDIEKASFESQQGALALSIESRLRKLDDLLWAYARLLAIEQDMDIYLEAERKEQLPESCATLEREIETLAAELTASKDNAPAQETRRKLLLSRRDRLDAIRQRLMRIDQARANQELVRSEQSRLVEQVKLIRADALASKNPEILTARIDLSIEHLAQTNRWLAELSEFKDLTQGIVPASKNAEGETASEGRQKTPHATNEAS